MRMKKLIAFLIALPLITALAADAGKMILMNCASRARLDWLDELVD